MSVSVGMSFSLRACSLLSAHNFTLCSGFISSSRFRERLPNHFRSRFSFVHENNTGGLYQL